jgi:hypothetical protein
MASGASGQILKPRAKGTPKPIVAAGAMFSEPAGWGRVQPPNSKTIGWFVNPGATSADATRMILVDFGRPTERDARATAEGLAKQWGGAVVNEPTSLDGVPGYRVRVEKHGPGLKPVEGIVVHREGRTYLLMGGAVPGQSIAEELEQVRRGWKWVKSR